MRPDDRVRILSMIEAAKTAADFVAGRQAAELNSDRMLLFALVRSIEGIGGVGAGFLKSCVLALWNIIYSVHCRTSRSSSTS